MHASDVTVAIPSYNRGPILVETIARLLELPDPPGEILVVDQTAQHPEQILARLEAWSAAGTIRWERLDRPSIPRAMNVALLLAGKPLVLFLDDDIEPIGNLVVQHALRHGDASIWAVVGQILQPGETPVSFERPAARPGQIPDLDFLFNSSAGTRVENVMAGNLSVVRERALALGGFDENYIGTAYRFETDFARRVVDAGGAIWFEPGAGIRHLRIASGGVRTYGDHRRTSSAAHSIGDYYFALQHFRGPMWRYAATRLQKTIATRYLLRHPWWIPAKLIGEARGYFGALRLRRQGPRLLERSMPGESRSG
ncbi:MAG TPA: glycosyltransferase [Thermoanaerobaculia bacterium]|nr:glycosyltransferase [Thermoanaerobaculia bacterium]